MARRSSASLKRMGVIALVLLALAMVAAFNLQKFPGFRGTDYHAELTDASGLHVGDIVQIAGIRVGRVDDLRISGNKVIVDFDVHGARLGDRTRASVQVLNLLGEKFLAITPKGSGDLPSGATIPLSRTDAGYDIVSTLDELTTTTGRIKLPRLSESLSTLAHTIDAASPEVRSSFTGLARLSKTVASRDQDISALLRRAHHVSDLLDRRKGDLVGLMKKGDRIFRELIARRDAIHALLVNARKLGVQLRGVVRDNQKQIRPALAELDRATDFLNARKKELSDTIRNYGPYASILINIIGTGPWFDAYVPNLVGIADSEFLPGKRPGL